MSNVAIVTADPKNRTVPWFGASTRIVKGLQSADQIMARFPEAFYPVELRPIFLGENKLVVGDDGLPTEIVEPTDRLMPNRYVTTRVHPDGVLTPYETVKSKYTIAQDTDVLARALNLVAASNGDAVFDSVAIFRDGAEVLFVLDLGSLIIDPAGIGDQIDRYLVVRNSHDGSTPITFLNTSIRVWCTNMLPSLEKTARAVLKARHTLNHEQALKEAEKVMRINVEWAREFKLMADTMLSIPMTPGRFDNVIEAVWPEANADTDLKKTRRDNLVETVKLTYQNNRNAGAVGDNGWAAFNAIVEFLDFSKNPTVGHRRGLLNHASAVNGLKRTARTAVLALN